MVDAHFAASPNALAEPPLILSELTRTPHERIARALNDESDEVAALILRTVVKDVVGRPLAIRVLREVREGRAELPRAYQRVVEMAGELGGRMLEFWHTYRVEGIRIDASGLQSTRGIRAFREALSIYEGELENPSAMVETLHRSMRGQIGIELAQSGGRRRAIFRFSAGARTVLTEGIDAGFDALFDEIVRNNWRKQWPS
jgi:hypothetical protein